jgi:hypothetical protein
MEVANMHLHPGLFCFSLVEARGLADDIHEAREL